MMKAYDQALVEAAREALAEVASRLREPRTALAPYTCEQFLEDMHALMDMWPGREMPKGWPYDPAALDALLVVHGMELRPIREKVVPHAGAARDGMAIAEYEGWQRRRRHLQDRADKVVLTTPPWLKEPSPIVWGFAADHKHWHCEYDWSANDDWIGVGGQYETFADVVAALRPIYEDHLNAYEARVKRLEDK